LRNDVLRCVTMDWKEPGNALFLVGVTRNEMGGSHYNLVSNTAGGRVPTVDLGLAPSIFGKLHEAMQGELIRSCHDLSEGGLGVALAEMAFAGEVGADVSLGELQSDEQDEVLLLSESPTRFLVEVPPANIKAFQECFADLPAWRIGETVKEQRLRVAGTSGEWIVCANLLELKEAWQMPLRW